MIRITTLIAVLALAGCARAENVIGIGRTLDDAKRDARQHALEELQQRVDLPDLLQPWRPTRAEVDGMIEGPGHAGPEIDFKDLGLQYQWILPVRFPSEAELVRRNLRAHRQGGAVLATMAAIGILSAWWGIANLRFGGKSHA